MHRKEVTHSDGSYERKSRWRKLADEMGRGKNISWYSQRLTHRKRVTSELHDSYFRLMTIKHSISKNRVGDRVSVELLYKAVKMEVEAVGCGRGSWNWVPVAVEFRPESSSSSGDESGRESHTRPKGPGALMSWGPEKMLIRCNKESHHTAEWAPRPPVEQP